MFCVKCGNALSEEQQFCTSCGNKVGKDSSNNGGEPYNMSEKIPYNSQKRNIDIEEASAKIVSEVSETVNNIVDKSKGVVHKIKSDEKINQCLNNVKQKPNTLKVFGCLSVAVIILFIGAFAMFRSTPEKTVKQFAKAIESKDIKKALSYTNYETVLKYNYDVEDLLGLDGIDGNIDKMIIELQEEFIEDYEGIAIKVNDINETFKVGSAAKVNVIMTVMDGGDIDSEAMNITLIKEKGKWLIDITDLGYLW